MWCLFLFDLDLFRHVPFNFRYTKFKNGKKQRNTYLIRVIVYFDCSHFQHRRMQQRSREA